jgi:hypothetical protein
MDVKVWQRRVNVGGSESRPGLLAATHQTYLTPDGFFLILFSNC